jgi:hypothetical protein
MPYKTGGLAALTPYHPARSGFLAKLAMDYNHIGVMLSPFSEAMAFSANDRVKLSYHADGFAQFSGEVNGNIISGRDPTTGEPKGLGLMTQPISSPLTSGPTFAVTVWGLNEFDVVGSNETTLNFEEKDLYYRGGNPSQVNAWLVEFFVFLPQYWAAVRKNEHGFSLNLACFGFEATAGVIEMRVIELGDQPIFLGTFASRIKVNFDTPSGWLLSGPGQKNMKGLGHVLMASYPKDAMGFSPVQSLDRVPENN